MIWWHEGSWHLGCHYVSCPTKIVNYRTNSTKILKQTLISRFLQGNSSCVKSHLHNDDHCYLWINQQPHFLSHQEALSCPSLGFCSHFYGPGITWLNYWHFCTLLNLHAVVNSHAKSHLASPKSWPLSEKTDKTLSKGSVLSIFWVLQSPLLLTGIKRLDSSVLWWFKWVCRAINMNQPTSYWSYSAIRDLWQHTASKPTWSRYGWIHDKDSEVPRTALRSSSTTILFVRAY